MRGEQMDSRVLGLLLALLTLPAAAQTVVDGDTLKLDGVTYRIWGIDAAETKQACADGWMAGKEATAAMLDLVKGCTVTCEAKAKDRYGRTVALPCRWRRPWRGDGEPAWRGAFTRYSSDYISQERAAIGANRRACERLREALGLAGAEQRRPVPPIESREPMLPLRLSRSLLGQLRWTWGPADADMLHGAAVRPRSGV